MFSDRSRKASFTRSQRADSPLRLQSVCDLNSRANSLDGKDITIEKSREGKKRKACLKIRAAHGSGDEGMQLIALLSPIASDWC